MQIPRIVRVAEKFTVDNSPLLLTGVAVAGVISTALLTGKATIKAVEIIQAEQREAELNSPPRDAVLASRKERFLMVWPLYIPAVSTGVVTITCVILANKIGTRRAAAMAAAYSLSEKAFEEYREKVVEKLGVNKEREARDEIAQERVNANPVGKTEVLVTGGGKALCYDQYSARYFESSMEKILKAQNDTNYQILNHDYCTLNAFYDRLGLPHVRYGDDVGWSTMEKLELLVTSVISEDDRPAIAFDFRTEPVRNFHLTH